MKKFFRTITKKDLKKSDNLFTKGTMSLDDKKNIRYFDNYSYQTFLRNLSNEGSENNAKKRNCNHLQRARKSTNTKKNKK